MMADTGLADAYDCVDAVRGIVTVASGLAQRGAKVFQRVRSISAILELSSCMWSKMISLPSAEMSKSAIRKLAGKSVSWRSAPLFGFKSQKFLWLTVLTNSGRAQANAIFHKSHPAFVDKFSQIKGLARSAAGICSVRRCNTR